MGNRISRRAFGKHAAVGIAAVAMPLAGAQTTPPDDKPKATEADVAKVEGQLAKPLSEEARKLLKSSIENSRKNGITRMKTKLADVTSPAFITPTFPADRRNL